MKKFLASFLSVLMVLTCIIIPGMSVSAATPEFLDHYNFSVEQEDIYAYVPTEHNDIEGGKVAFKPDSTRDERSVWPLVAPGALGGGYGNGGSAVYEQIERNGEMIDSLALTTVNYNSFIPIMKDGKPFELKPDTTYTVNISYYVTGNSKTSAPTLYVAGGTLLNTYFSSVAELGQNKIPAWDDAILGRPFSSAKVTLPKGTSTTLEDGTSVTDVTDAVKNTLVTNELTFTTKAAPADGDTSYSYDPEENVYTVAVNDSKGNSIGDYSISNYFHIVIWGSTKLKLNITHLEITSEDYVPQTTVEYVVDGEVVKTDSVNQGTDYAINYIHPHTDTKRFAGWYYDEALTQKVAHNTTSVSTDGIDKLCFYAKMVEYETNVTMPINNDSWGIGYYPYVNANGAYLFNVSTKRNSSSGYLTADADKLSLVANAYRTFIIVAENPENGDLLVAKDGAEYKLTIKYKVNKSADDNFRMWAGYDIAEGGTVGGANAFAYSSAESYITDNNVSTEIKEVSQNIIVDERSGGYPFLGFRVMASAGFEVDFYELKVEEIIGEDISTGEFLVTNSAENRNTYKVEFDYKLNAEIEENIGIGFKTIASDKLGYPTFVEGENVAIYSISKDKTVGEWNKATAFVTTDMTANVTTVDGTDDTLEALNSLLYAYIIGEENYSKISVKDVVCTDLDDVVGLGKVYFLNEEAEAASDNQALRYSFTYNSTMGSDIIIDGVSYTVKSRGFIYLNGQSYALSGKYLGDINLTNAKARDNIFHAEKSTDLEKCWDYVDSTLYYSTYINGFTSEDTKELMIRGYITFECEGQTFTVYSDTFNRSVAYMKSL